VLDEERTNSGEVAGNTHVRNIYAKLQADNRSSAVRRARELQLLATGRARPVDSPRPGRSPPMAVLTIEGFFKLAIL
jgi:hypothetical protein